ncbi:hypothetical protein MARI151_50198 [Maribacter litoralis]|uniref:Uncharacterized protein n=1 Tax=Maribacter litoralis TaxID=2059726 RepID=A0A653UN84_9FLAO|nr:hypothetical protein MARI151_50198 [Maribacter litoralis]
MIFGFFEANAVSRKFELCFSVEQETIMAQQMKSIQCFI